MQTFLPYPDFVTSAKVLDYKRLGNQRSEANMLLQLILGVKDNHWKHHAIARMWWDFPFALALYRNCIVEEWVARGYENNMKLCALPPLRQIEMPTWLGDKKFHASHRSILLQKLPKWYGKFRWKEQPGTEPVYVINGRYVFGDLS